LEPQRKQSPPAASIEEVIQRQTTPSKAEEAKPVEEAEKALQQTLAEKHFTIRYDDTGHSYESLFGDYIVGVKQVVVEDPYIRIQHQIQNFVRFCELLARQSTVRSIKLITGYDNAIQKNDVAEKLYELAESLKDSDIELKVEFNSRLHDRAIKLDNGWIVKIGRGLDIYQKPQSWFEVGANDLNLRRCLETNVDIFRQNKRSSL
jgi:ATP-dependent Lon protease